MSKKLTAPAVIDWVFYHKPTKDGWTAEKAKWLQEELKAAPPGAAALLDWAKQDSEGFYKLWSARIVKQQLDQEQRMGDDGTPVLQLIARLCAALGQPIPPECGPQDDAGKPAVPGEVVEVSAEEL